MIYYFLPKLGLLHKNFSKYSKISINITRIKSLSLLCKNKPVLQSRSRHYLRLASSQCSSLDHPAHALKPPNKSEKKFSII